MKKSIYVFCSMAFMVLVSCSDDDFSRVYVDTEAKTELVAQFELGRDFSAPGLPISFTAVLPQSFELDANVEITAITADFISIKSFYTLPAGETTISDFVVMPGTGFVTNSINGRNDFATIQVTGVALVNPEPEEGEEEVELPPVVDPFTLTSEAKSLQIIDRDPDWMRLLEDRSITYSMDWENPSEIDLDLFLVPEGGVLADNVENSETGSRWEGDFLDNSKPDGNYEFIVVVFSNTGGDIPYSLHFLRDDNSAEYYTNVLAGPFGDDVVEVRLPYVLTKTTTTDSEGVETVYVTIATN